jgi:beta-N-acetylhexosaminidase
MNAMNSNTSTPTATVTSALYGPLVLDLAGLTMTDAEAVLLQDVRVGGVILFARNFTNREQLCALTASIHAVRAGTRLPKLLIAVDHEGGRVQRFKTDGFTHLPTMASLGKLWHTDALAAQRLASQVGFVLAAELLACGVDLSFTPVLDLDYGQSDVIGDRAFAANPQQASELARALISGLHRAGMRSCGKHFPGHGFVAADSHHEIPVDERDLAAIMSVDAAPYAALRDVLDSVMPAHVIYPKVDSQPAGFSRIWLDILRDPKQSGFEGVAFSDDLSMAGATVAGDIHARAKAALSAGCDMVLVCNAPEMAIELLGGTALNQTPAQALISHERIARLVPNTLSALHSWASLNAYAPYQQALTAVQAAVQAFLKPL